MSYFFDIKTIGVYDLNVSEYQQEKPMDLTVDTEKIKALFRSKKLNVRGLTSRANLSRQGYYDMLKSDYQPFSKGIAAIARVLGVSPLDLLKEAESSASEIKKILAKAEKGDARSFEILPATLFALAIKDEQVPGMLPLQYRLFAAASEIVYVTTGQKKYKRLASKYTPGKNGRAFFFGADMMDASRILQKTPEPMRKHDVFGVFELEDFQRHFK